MNAGRQGKKMQGRAGKERIGEIDDGNGKRKVDTAW